MGSVWGRALAACGVLCSGVIWACSQGDPKAPYIPDPPLKEAGGTIVDAGGDGPASTCTGGDGGCNALENCATKVFINQLAQDPPTPTGGTVPDGTYVLTSYTAFTGTGGPVGQLTAWFRETMKFTTEPTDGGPADSGSVQQMVWLDITATNSSPTDSTSSGTTYFTTSTSVDFDTACPSKSLATFGFSVSGTQVILYVDNGTSTGELTFTKQ
jgi:hypothetical protein